MTANDSILVQNLVEPAMPEMRASRVRTAETSIKTILFHVHDDDGVLERLQLALSLARACSAHIHCLYVIPIQAYTVVDTYGGTFVSQEIVDACSEEAAKLRARIEKQLRSEDVPWTYEQRTDAVLPSIVQCAALSDLIVTGREPRQRDLGGRAVTLIGDLLAQCRTPLLVTGEAAAEWDPCGTAVIAWNGSYEAANAVRSNLSLLRQAGEVRVVEFSEKKARHFPSTKLLEFLSRHGISAELDSRSTTKPVEDALVSYAERLKAALIVMGGYSHSRAGEFLFGGVTRALLKDCPIPLAIAH